MCYVSKPGKALWPAGPSEWPLLLETWVQHILLERSLGGMSAVGKNEEGEVLVSELLQASWGTWENCLSFCELRFRICKTRGCLGGLISFRNSLYVSKRFSCTLGPMDVNICTHLNHIAIFISGLNGLIKRRNCTLFVLNPEWCLTPSWCFQFTLAI